MKIIKYNLNEALSIDDEYKKNWSMIDRPFFDTILTLDPKTNIEKNFIGPTVKQLILPRVAAGENIADIVSSIPDAISEFTANRATLPAQLRNAANFPTVHDFVDYIENGDDSEFAKTLGTDSVSTEPKAEEDRITDIYNQYYAKDITRDVFDTIIALDPQTTKKAIGPIAKNLLLRCYIAGEQDFLKDINSIDRAIYIYHNDDTLEKEKKDIGKYQTIAAFIDTMCNNVIGGKLLDYLKECPQWKNIEYVGRSQLYDVFITKTESANAYVAGADAKWGHIGNCTAPGFTDNGVSKNWLSNVFGHWCTSGGHWGSYSQYRLYCFMALGDRLTSDDRSHNFQLAVQKNGYVYSCCDGVENGRNYRDLLAEDPSIPFLFANETDYLGNNELFKVNAKINEIKEVLEINSPADFPISLASKDKNYENLLRFIVKDIIIGENIKIIPPLAFSDFKSLTRVIIKGPVTRIGAQAFKNCSNLLTIELPNTLKVIGAEAFENCTKLHGAIRIPNSVEAIKRRAFAETGKNLSLNVYNNRGEKNLGFPAEEHLWYRRHLKGINVSESLALDETIIERDADGNEVVKEKAVPADLLNAYKSAYDDTNGWATDPRLGGNRYTTRYRKALIDFAHSTYRKLNANDIQHIFTLGKEQFKQEITRLRILFDGDLIIYTIRPNGTLYATFRNSNKHVTLNINGERKEFANVGYVSGISWIKALLLDDRATVYWTDEDEHRIHREPNLSAKGLDMETQSPDNDHFLHKTNPEAISHLHLADRVSNLYSIDWLSGKKGAITQSIRDLCYNISESFNLIFRYRYSYMQWKKIYNRMKQNIDDYAPVEIEQVVTELEKVRKLYSSAKQETDEYERKLSSVMQSNIFVQNLFSGLEQIDRISKLCKVAADEMRSLKRDYESKSASIVQDNPELQALVDSMGKMDKELIETQKQSDELASEVNKLRKQMEELQKKIAEKIAAKEEIDAKLPELIEKASNSQEKLLDIVDDFVERKNKELDKIQQTIYKNEDILDHYTNKYAGNAKYHLGDPSHYQQNRPNHIKDFDPELLAKLNVDLPSDLAIAVNKKYPNLSSVVNVLGAIISKDGSNTFSDIELAETKDALEIRGNVKFEANSESKPFIINLSATEPASIRVVDDNGAVQEIATMDQLNPDIIADLLKKAKK